ncbi:MAG TPA: zinc-binding alcohol dehydrogenase family protein [Acetobacteraceae bacterium]|jgi:NADPH2:quinone reductase|nr:zinc-binding alcohol dehydrogenase family protein [Acetobacteraceae bacterium]
MRRLRVLRKAETIDDIDLRIETCDAPPRGADEVLVEVRAAGVNRSDVAAAMGRMPQAVWPRTPGRDWSGVVAEGPSDLIGREVFGAGGDLGITRDGTHASQLVVHQDAVVEKPATLTLEEAGALGVPFVTAHQGFHRAGMPQPGDVVLVTAVNGMVGQAAAQIAAMRGSRVFGVTRRAEAFVHPHCPVFMIDASNADVATVLRDETDGHGADIVYNTVGSPYFDAANQAMAHGGRQILISTVERPVPFDIFTFYRGEHTFVGVDSLALDAHASAALLRELLPGFASGQLRPMAMVESANYPLERALDAYRTVHSIARNRVTLLP